jgi:dolichyl-phosphate-mannose-protein mannosyltransferase
LLHTAEQQITLYPHKDDNNWWRISKQYGGLPSDIEWVKDGDIIRLDHVSTDKRLHSHEVRPPMTDLEYHNEVRYADRLQSSRMCNIAY